MAYCNNCRLKIKTNRNICPLCLKELNNNDNEIINEEYHSYEWLASQLNYLKEGIIKCRKKSMPKK